MKFLILVLSVAVVSAGDWPGFPRRRSLERRDTVANINDYADEVLAQVKVFMTANGYEPIVLTDQYAFNFPITDLIGLVWNTRLGLYDGEGRYFSNIHRVDDAVLTYTSDSRSLNLNIEVQFDRVEVGYHYAAQLLSFGPKGLFTAIVKELKASMDISIDLRSFNATLNNFSLDKAKSIKVDVKGLTLLGDWAVEAFVNTFTTVLKGPILKVIEGKVRTAIEEGVNSVNAGPFLSS